MHRTPRPSGSRDWPPAAAVPGEIPWRHFLLTFVSPAVLTFALFLGLIFAVIVPTMKRNIMDRKKEMIRALTQTAWSELASLQAQEQRGAITRADAQQAAIDRLNRRRYGDDGKNYFWISDLQTRMVMHPYRLDLNGRDLTEYADPAGKRLFVEFTKAVRENGDGYVDYLWQWQDDDRRIVPKLSYVKEFAPWGWIVGTGIYLEDVRTQIDQVIHRVVLVAFAISGIVAALLAYLARQGLNLERHRWRAESALRASEEKYRLLVESASEGILLILQDRPCYANQALLRRLDYTEAALCQLPLERLIESLPSGAPAGSTTERRARLIARNGDASDVFLTWAPVTIGDQTGQIVSVKDVAWRRKSEETLGRLVAELQSLLPLATRAIKSSPRQLLACDPQTSIQQAAATMASANSSSIVVKSADGGPAGIVTDRDLRTRVLAAGVSPAEPVSSIMSAPLVSVPDRALLFEAARIMQERSLHHLVVTGERGEPRGVLTGNEILHAQGHAIGVLLGAIQQARSAEELRDCRAKLPVFLKALLESGARVEITNRILTAVSDAILARLVALAEAEQGPPPTTFSFVALGSEARGEQTLASDQDNAIIFADVSPERAAAVQTYFRQLGGRVCAGLDLVGYQRCPGDVMASNPKWCQPLSQWRQYFTTCVTAANPQDLLDVNIFFDFRSGHGEAALVDELHRHLWSLFAGEDRHAFFFHLAQSTLQFRPPRGFFGTIQLESVAGHPAAFNVKTAIIPLVNFARIYALKQGVAETNTLERLHRLRDQGLLQPSSHDELAQVFTTLTQMRLTHQVAQWSRGLPPDNFIDLPSLTQLDRSVLKRAFADLAVFQARLATDFARTA